MRRKKFTYGVTFFITPEMYAEIIKVTDALAVGVSEFLRGLIEDYTRKNPFKNDMEVNDDEKPD